MPRVLNSLDMNSNLLLSRFHAPPFLPEEDRFCGVTSRPYSELMKSP